MGCRPRAKPGGLARGLTLADLSSPT
jgi:hypothetical protein